MKPQALVFKQDFFVKGICFPNTNGRINILKVFVEKFENVLFLKYFIFVFKSVLKPKCKCGSFKLLIDCSLCSF